MSPAPSLAGLTVEDWMLVHLLRFTRFASAFEAPWGMTQYGIAEAVGTGQDHVSRAARRLAQRGLVAETKRRVAGVQKRRKVYHLTPEGEAAALAIQSTLERTPVRVTEGGVERSIPLADIVRLMERRHTIIELARAIRSDGTLDREGLAASGRAEEVEPAQVVPATPGFVGRRRELEALKRLIEEKKMVILHGIAGIGKTSLAARLVQELSPPRPTFWYRFREWDTLRNLLTPFSEFLQREGRRRLRAYLASRQEIDLNAVCYLVLESVRELRALLVFDDVHKASDTFTPCFKLLTEVLEKSEGVRALLTTRRLPAFYSRSEVVVRGLVAELKLEGLDEEASSQLLRARNIAPAYHRRAFLLTGGHPLALELYKPGSGEAEERLDINKYIEEEISARLTPAELKVLRMASLHRCPVPAEALLQDPELPYETLQSLVSRSLLMELPGGVGAMGPAPDSPRAFSGRGGREEKGLPGGVGAMGPAPDSPRAF
ncbi:MAG: AAA family ATPase, partial [Thermoplasmatota archaeon]